MARSRVKRFLGIDGGGSKTAFLLIDESGKVLASHTEGPAYYLEIGLDPMRQMLTRGIAVTTAEAGLSSAAIDFAFVGLPAYGEDSAVLAALDAAASPTLNRANFRCGNDAVCGWAGGLACEDGINVIAGTGSMAYGEFEGRAARAGGWGELFGDEGSAYWIVREGLTLFSRMSDTRAARGSLYDLMRAHFKLRDDLDLCAAIYGRQSLARSQLAALSAMIAQAAASGDEQARALFDRAADELLQVIDAVSRQLAVPKEVAITVSYSGGLFRQSELLLSPLKLRLAAASRSYRLALPKLPPVGGAALYAARLNRSPLSAQAVEALANQLRP
jgi:N-acetylglucosamine kinase-like BadF-type ATPase